MCRDLMLGSCNQRECECCEERSICVRRCRCARQRVMSAPLQATITAKNAPFVPSHCEDPPSVQCRDSRTYAGRSEGVSGRNMHVSLVCVTSTPSWSEVRSCQMHKSGSRGLVGPCCNLRPPVQVIGCSAIPFHLILYSSLPNAGTGAPSRASLIRAQVI